MKRKRMIFTIVGLMAVLVFMGGCAKLAGQDSAESKLAENRIEESNQKESDRKEGGRKESDRKESERKENDRKKSEQKESGKAVLVEVKAVELVTAGQDAEESAGTVSGSTTPDSSEGFVLLAEAVPDVIQEIRYYSTYNFVGERIDGYEEPCAMLTREAAAALKEVSDEVEAQGYRLKVYDAYRPQMAVDHFIRWAADSQDIRMKEYFYPEVDKSRLFAEGYIGAKSGHSRGSTVDLTLLDMKTGKEVDMGGTFDYFGERSHPDYTKDLTEEQIHNRAILREVMVRHGFRPLATEWWHFTLNHEPYPDIYFTFPVSSPQP